MSWMFGFQTEKTILNANHKKIICQMYLLKLIVVVQELYTIEIRISGCRKKADLELSVGIFGITSVR